MLKVRWSGDPYDNHVSTFELDYLRHIAHYTDNIAMPQHWDAVKMRKSYEGGHISTNYDKLLRSERQFTKILSALDRYGLAFVTDVPKEEKAVEVIGEMIGPLRHTFYGRTWDVKDKPNAENVAYTATELDLHMDLL